MRDLSDLSVPEVCAYLRLLRASLVMLEEFLSKGWPTFDEQALFWTRYADAERYCDIVNQKAGLKLLIEELEGKGEQS